MSSPVDTTSAKSYLDFSGLGELRAKAQHSQEKALKETAQQFEGMFIQMMMKSMREASTAFKDEEHESSARETFEGLFDKEISLQMSKRNSLGVANFLERAVRQQMPAAAEVLKARDGKGLPLHTPAQPMSLQPGEARGLPLERPVLKNLNDWRGQPRALDGGGS